MTEKKQPGPYPIRPSPRLRQKLEIAARNSGRSLHSEIIARLEASFSLPQPAAESPENMINSPEIRDIIKREVERFLSQSDLRKIVEQAIEDQDVSKG